MEIERKFLVSRLPNALERYPCTRMEQAYVSTEPVIRVRRAGERYMLTCKGRGLLSREEFELDLTPEAFARLREKADGAAIVKDRYRVPLGAHTVELDVFREPLAPLALAEVEFPTEAAAQAFAPPDWFGREVTYDPAYTNAALSQNGLPDSFQTKYDPKDLRSVLLYVRQKFDTGAFEQASRIFSILLDFAPDLKREANVLRQMSDAGLLRDFRKASESGNSSECLRVAAKGRDWLSDYLMLPDEKADYFVTALQALYGMEAEPPKPVPVPPQKPAIMDSGNIGDCTWTLDTKGVLTVSGHGKMNARIPWWSYKERIQTVVIGDGVTSIVDYAFFACSALENVTIPDSVTAIGHWAFYSCDSLEEVSVPKSTDVYPDAFPLHTQIIRRRH